ncbi:hypothetical protein A2U01_0070426, partial [Trifolium medium]|nr:hypothetical protein [Trifolium medium]
TPKFRDGVVIGGGAERWKIVVVEESGGESERDEKEGARRESE